MDEPAPPTPKQQAHDHREQERAASSAASSHVRSRVSSNASSLSPISPLPSPLHRPDMLPTSRPQTPIGRQPSSSSGMGTITSTPTPAAPSSSVQPQRPHWEAVCATLPPDSYGVDHFEARRRAWLAKPPVTSDPVNRASSHTDESSSLASSTQATESGSPSGPIASGSAVLASTTATMQLARASSSDPNILDIPRAEVLPSAHGTAFVSLGPPPQLPGQPPIPHLSPSALHAHASGRAPPALVPREMSSTPTPRGFSIRNHRQEFAQVADDKVLAILSKQGPLSDDDWRTLRGIHTALMGGQRLRVPMPMDKLVGHIPSGTCEGCVDQRPLQIKLLQAGWMRDGTWPPGADAPDY